MLPRAPPPAPALPRPRPPPRPRGAAPRGRRPRAPPQRPSKRSAVRGRLGRPSSHADLLCGRPAGPSRARRARRTSLGAGRMTILPRATYFLLQDCLRRVTPARGGAALVAPATLAAKRKHYARIRPQVLPYVVPAATDHARRTARSCGAPLSAAERRRRAQRLAGAGGAARSSRAALQYVGQDLREDARSGSAVAVRGALGPCAAHPRVGATHLRQSCSNNSPGPRSSSWSRAKGR